MMHLLKIEWLKVKNYRTFWILCVLYLISIWGINFIVYTIQEKVFEKKVGNGAVNLLVGDKPYTFPKVWQMSSYVSSYLLFIAGLIMIILITNEYSFKTHRQNIIDGLSRTQFILVKLVDGIIIALISTILVFITAFIFATVEGHTQTDFSNSEYLFYFFLQALSYCWIGIFFGLLFKRSGIAIGVFFLYAIVLENVLVLIFNRVVSESFFLHGFGNYLPIETTNKLMPVPVFEGIQKQFNSETNVTLQLILAIAYLVFYIIFSKRRFEISDL